MSDDRPNPADRTRFEEALARGLEDQPPPSSGPCPDAEILAACSEDSLPTPDRQGVELHLATCVSCQAHIAGLIRTEESERPFTQPGTSWWLDWRWLTPLATTAVVLLAVWAVDPTSVRDSGTEKEEAAPVALDTDASSDLLESTAAIRQERTIDDEGVLEREQASTAEVDRAKVADAAKVLEEAEAPTPQDTTVAGDPPPARASTESTDAAPAAPLVESRLDNLTRLSRTASPLRARASDQFVALVTVASDQTAVWRATPEGGLEHSTDGGSTWTDQLASTGATLTAGSAPSGSVCWLVGRDATILRTVDGGASWISVEAPLPSDIVGVSATDGQTVVVEFSGGQAFASTDGGSTWTPR